MAPKKEDETRIERTQLGVRMESRMVKVLKAMSEYHDITLGTLLEGIVLYAFEGKSPFNVGTMERIDQLKDIYGMDYDSTTSELFQIVEGHHDKS